MLELTDPRLRHDGHFFEETESGTVFGQWEFKIEPTPSRQYIYLLDDYVVSEEPIVQRAIYRNSGDLIDIAPVMSDLPFEVYVQRESIKDTEGIVLIAGLGMGMVLRMLEKRDSVDKIIVIEKSKDLLDFVGNVECSKTLEIVNADLHDCVGDFDCDWAVFDHFGPLVGNYDEIKRIQSKCRAPNQWFWDSDWWKDNLTTTSK